MVKREKFILRLISGSADNNINFRQLIDFLMHLGFEVRKKGSHHIFYMQGIEEIINLQPKGNKAKPYQVKQVRQVILKYKLLKDE
jgi:predicted RNA binding protein YcfA (HicA-like mRNA interferase family)